MPDKVAVPKNVNEKIKKLILNKYIKRLETSDLPEVQKSAMISAYNICFDLKTELAFKRVFKTRFEEEQDLLKSNQQEEYKYHRIATDVIAFIFSKMLVLWGIVPYDPRVGIRNVG